jgi:cytoskeletal protein RodZ
MEESTPIQSTPTETVGFPGAAPVPPQRSKKSWKWLIILILFLIVIGGVTFFVFKSSRSASTLDDNTTPQPTSSLTDNFTPEPTPAATPADKSQINIQVLNGTGIAGEAGLLSDQLKNLGYTSITTGNAPDQNATDTQVTFGPNVSQDVVTEITGKLNTLYTSVTTNNSTLNGVDIQITTGLRKGQSAATAAPADTASPAPTATPGQ